MPYQPTVTRGLKKALDDPKRRVRLAAADARNDWYLLGHGAAGPTCSAWIFSVPRDGCVVAACRLPLFLPLTLFAVLRTHRLGRTPD